MRKAVLLALVGLAAVGLAPSAGANVLFSGPGTSNLTDVACPTSRTCVAVGYPAHFGGKMKFVLIHVGTADVEPSVSTSYPIDGMGGPTGIACPTSTKCEVVGYSPDNTGSVIAPIDVASRTAGTAVSLPGLSSAFAIAWPTTTTGLAGIACADSSDCTAVGYGGPSGSEGAVVSITAPASVTKGALDSSNGEISDVACPSGATCEGVTVDSDASGTQGASVPIDL